MIGVPTSGGLMAAEADFWDADIAALKLSDGEKNGLQVFRNYTKAFEKNAAKRFVSESDSNSYNTNVLDGILLLIGTEDIRFLPVVVCSFSDEQLEQMFKERNTSECSWWTIFNAKWVRKHVEVFTTNTDCTRL